MKINLPYGRSHIEMECQEAEIKAVLTPRFEQTGVDPRGAAAVEAALANPIGSARLSELARGKEKILLITSDHTRPVPSHITLPILLKEIRAGNPVAEIVILVATGAHRATSLAEMREKFGAAVCDREKIVVHDGFDREAMVDKGVLPSGCQFSVNRLTDWADLIVAEGFIEPHFFAGFSGGRKSILPGIAGASSIYQNHCARLIAAGRARTGVLEGNPIHADMVAAARMAGLGFILNVVLDADKQIVSAFAGHPEQAHLAGCEFVRENSGVRAVEADIVVTTNGGYPLDQNVYQAVKCMTAAEACVRQGGVIVCVAECGDGSGGEAFRRWFADADGDPDAVMKKITGIPAEETQPDQWQAQILARVRQRARVIMVADPAVRPVIEEMGMCYAASIGDALAQAKEWKPERDGMVVIPDGVSVIVE